MILVVGPQWIQQTTESAFQISVLLENQQQLFKQANHVVYSHPGAKLEMLDKGFAAGMKLGLSRGLDLSLTQASSRVDSFRKLCSFFLAE